MPDIIINPGFNRYKYAKIKDPRNSTYSLVDGRGFITEEEAFRKQSDDDRYQIENKIVNYVRAV